MRITRKILCSENISVVQGENWALFMCNKTAIFILPVFLYDMFTLYCAYSTESPIAGVI